jgi:hypothetical protein
VASYRTMTEQAVDMVSKEGRRVFLVAKDQKGISQLYDMIMASGRVPARKVYKMEESSMITLTPELVNGNKVPDYHIVIGKINRSLGFSLTTCDTLIMSVYPSNVATRIQVEHRLVRSGNLHKQVNIVTVHAGLLLRMMAEHTHANSFVNALQSMF